MLNNALGDLDIFVYDADQTPLDGSVSETDSERLTIPVIQNEMYFIQVAGFEDATNPNYELLLTVNSKPKISDLANQVIEIDTATDALPFTVDDAETPVDELTIRGTSSNQALITDENIAFEGGGHVRSVVVTPQPGQIGATTITVTVTDTGGETSFETFSLTVVPRRDFGDAPDATEGTATEDYNTFSTHNGPSHIVVPDVFMGAGVDGELDSNPTLLADGDDTTGTDDEDGLVDASLIMIEGTAPAIDVVATNNTGESATLYGWIDFNRNGIFENVGERASQVVPVGSISLTVTLTFPEIPSGSAGWTYGRFRLSTDAAAGYPTGAASDGEVEDHRLPITGPGDANLDGRVSFADFLRLQNQFNQQGSYTDGDFNHDNIVSFADFLILQNAFNQVYFTAPLPALAVAAAVLDSHDPVLADFGFEEDRQDVAEPLINENAKKRFIVRQVIEDRRNVFDDVLLERRRQRHRLVHAREKIDEFFSESEELDMA